ncbi:MAG TPA: histidine kinase [Ruminiclostridium sp.]|nr:histidine kinase [Ruminiclostridium sp.]
MVDLVDKLIIFAACLVFYVMDAGYATSIVPVIAAVTAASLSSYFDRAFVRLVIMAAYITACLFKPAFLVFLPLICYDILVTRHQILCLLGLLPVTIHPGRYSKMLLVAVLVVFGFSYLLRYRTSCLNKTHSEYTKYRDVSKENSILLEKKNKDLIEKQDYEINVATLNERNRIAMEIHDNVGHLLSRCLLQLGALMAVNKDVSIKENLSSIKDTMSQAMDSIRRSVHNLHDESIDLYSQINALVSSFTFCDISLEYDISEKVDKKVKYCFIAIVKEAFSNIIKHSTATQARVSLLEHPAFYQLIIHDNGNVVSYDSDNGIGLSNITERVNALNGNIHINAENGFRIFISIPKDKVN